MIIFKTGDIFDSEADIIGHGTNTEGLMGSGIAVQFKKRYPKMHREYVRLCEEQDWKRLVGTAAIWVNDFSEIADFDEQPAHYIANIFSQDKPGPHGDYDWTRKGINQVMNFALQNGLSSIALPRIGCGVAGLDWYKMQTMIFDNFEKFSVDIELWSLDNADAQA